MKSEARIREIRQTKKSVKDDDIRRKVGLSNRALEN